MISHRVSKVLRLRENDQIMLLDGQGLVYSAQILSFFSRGVQCRLLSRKKVNTEPELKITLAQSLLKGPRFDYALQKNTELGVSEFIPVISHRTVVKLDEDFKFLDKKLERYNHIVQSAAEQSERGIIPEVKNIMTMEELCKSNLAAYDLKLVCKERSESNLIKEVLNGIQDKVHKVLVLVGPEGGFNEEEIKLTQSSGFIPVSLGKRIYRAETVGTVISSILFFYFNDLN